MNARYLLFIGLGLAGCGSEGSASLSGAVSGVPLPGRPQDAFFKLSEQGFGLKISERGGTCSEERVDLRENTVLDLLIVPARGAQPLVELAPGTYPSTATDVRAVIDVTKSDCKLATTVQGMSDVEVVVESVTGDQVVGHFSGSFLDATGKPAGRVTAQFDAYRCAKDWDPRTVSELNCQ